MKRRPGLLMLPSVVVASHRLENAWLIELRGRFTHFDLSDVTAATARGLGIQEGPIVFELGGLLFCDSSLLNHFLATRRLRRVVLTHVPDLLHRMLDITGTLDVFEFGGDAESTVA
ncbi:STAS domain-containing protein [Streptomyces sp. NPDC001941]|uniref:STAS domain-containing protein n=1 Tax=Streptomyces sp. NPDC001941 TaxID=3154659 RepID=UPI00332D09BF